MTTRYQVFKINEDGTEDPQGPKYRTKSVAEVGRDSAERVAKFEYRHQREKGCNDYRSTFLVREVQGE